MSALYKDIGGRISALRRENQLTQAELAEQLDISIKHLSEVERGITCLSLDKLVTVCSILSANMDFLIQGIDHRNAETAKIPSYILELFNSDDETQKQLLQQTILLFKKTYQHK